MSQTKLGEVFGFDKVEATPSPKRSKKEDDWITEMVWAIQGPIMVWPGYEDMIMPDNIKGDISIERLLNVVTHDKMASEVETMWYISTASLAQPPNRDWTEIYMWLCRRWMLKQEKEEKNLPDFLQRPIELAEYTQKPDLERLRRWLYDKSMKALKCKLKS